ncbi:MAG TPA: SDR family oxidoreductase [Cellulomonas sp.]
MTTLDGATVLVTGANGGLGTELVHQSLARGAVKVYAAARTPRTWEDDRVVPLRLDVTDHEQVVAAAALADDTTVLVNNAGIARGASLLDLPLADLDALIATNLVGPIDLTRELAAVLRAHRGAVVNVASVLSWAAWGNGYSVSKAGLWAATNALRLTFTPDGVQVLGAYLGYTDTPMNAGRDTTGFNTAADVVRQILDGLEAGADEVLADDTTRTVRAALSGPVRALYPQLDAGPAAGPDAAGAATVAVDGAAR